MENRQLDAQRRKEEEAKLQEEVRQRYEDGGSRFTREALEEDDDYDGSGAVRFQELPDATRDPRLWLMKCKPNQEKMLVIQLMQKFLDSMHTDKPLQIKSAACTDIKGYIYIEAYKEVHVREATQGLNHLFYRITQVPVNEMTDVMRVRVDAKKKPLTRGMWVRCRRNDEYKDDLAQVIALENDGSRATVRLIPRLRVYVTRGLDEDEGARTMRPPAKIFNVDEIEGFVGEGEVTQSTRSGRKTFNYDGNAFEDGLILKTYSTRNLRWDNVVPSLTELERFKAGLGTGAEDDLLTAVQPADIVPRESFNPGDIVKVRENSDLKHIVGVVQSIDPTTGSVVVMPTSTEGLLRGKLFKHGLSFQPEQLQKWFKMGDHVKIVGGSRHVGETGLVVRVGRAERSASEVNERRAVAPDQLYIFSDLTQTEIIVPAVHVQECTDVSSGLEQLGQYQLHDLVSLDRTGAGVIVKVEHSSFKVLSTANEELSIDHTQMGRRKTSRGVVVLGVDEKKLEINSPVNIVNGEHKGRAGIIKHIFKSFIFVHDVKRKERSGIIVTSFVGRWADGSRTPSHDLHNNMRTPLRDDGFRTPMHESIERGTRTPMHDGSRTPMHDGSRTPMHDPFSNAPSTPMHDGSRTPLHGASAWDPGARTPVHRPSTPKQSTYEDSFASQWAEFGGGSGAGGQSPFHSGGGTATIGASMESMDVGYGTFTGGLGLDSNPFLDTDHNFLSGLDSSPFGNTTPSGSVCGSELGTAPSLGSSQLNAGSSQWTPSSPTNSAASSTPLHVFAASVGSGGEQLLPENIQVKLLADGRKGTIVEVDNGSYGVEVEAGEPLLRVRREEVDVELPKKKDRLIIFKGELAGHTGTLIGIDGTDGIVKMTTNSDIKILDLKSCAKLADVLA